MLGWAGRVLQVLQAHHRHPAVYLQVVCAGDGGGGGARHVPPPLPQVRHSNPPLVRLVLTLASPPAIGSHTGYILPPLLRLVLTLGIYCLPSCEWFSHWVYTASPPAIGSHT
eukprot:1180728-Prorocentrum_minimum.AAC.1